MRNYITLDGILLVVQGEDDLCDMSKILDRGICREEIVPDEEHEFQEGSKLDCPDMACAIGVFAGPKAAVEPQLDQVGDIPGFGVRGVGCRGHDGVDDTQGCGLFPLDWGIFNPLIFEFLVKVLV